ncbi:MAG TPA: DUF2505 family protein [bacterium]|nr:DUF2505 family protein [bacterium]
MKVEKAFYIEADPEKVLAAMTSPALLAEDHKSRKCLSFDLKDLNKTASEHKYQIVTTEYTRGLGGIDKDKTEKHTVVHTWNLGAKQSNWVWSSDNEMSNKAQISGGTGLKAKGKGTEVTMMVEIDVKIPMVGKMIAGKLKEGFEKGWPLYIERVTAWVKK